MSATVAGAEQMSLEVIRDKVREKPDQEGPCGTKEGLGILLYKR